MEREVFEWLELGRALLITDGMYPRCFSRWRSAWVYTHTLTYWMASHPSCYCAERGVG